MRRLFVLVLFIGLGFWGANTMLARGDSSWTRLSSGIEKRTFTWKGSQITAFRAPASRIKVAGKGYLEAGEWLTKTKSKVAINGGYFDGDGKSLGLRVSGGRQFKALRSADWGVFWIKNGKAHINHTRDYPRSILPDEAVQCGPRLVVAGKLTKLKPQWARRTGMGIDSRGRVVLAISDGELLLPDWAEAFASNSALGCRDALNLDGGPSTQAAYVEGNKKEQVLGGWPVPDAIVIR